MRLDKKVAVVTGAGRGIGRAIATRLAEEGAKVIVSDIDAAFAENVAEKLRTSGTEAVAIKADVTSWAEVEAMFEQTAQQFGEIHILVNNAGIRKDIPFHKITAEEWDSAIAIQLKGSFNCARAVQAYMVKQNYGKIVNLAAPVPASMSDRGQTSYASANAGIWGFTKALALELGRHDINVNCVAPDYIDTMMTRSLVRRRGLYLDDFQRFAAAQVPLRRLGTPDDVANVVLFLVSDEASFVSGQIIFVQGGP